VGRYSKAVNYINSCATIIRIDYIIWAYEFPAKNMMSTFFKKFIVFAYILSLSISSCVSGEVNDTSLASYHWGRGLTIASANLNIGGYINIDFEHFESKQDVATIDDLSLFISWSPHAQIHFFSEIEMESLISTNGIANFNESFSIERLYVDYLVTDSFSIRFGQFLTPVGIWNATHAAPLVWTTSRPVVTKSLIFPSRTNGLMLSKEFAVNERDLNIFLFFDDSNDLDPRQLYGGDDDTHINPEVAFEHAMGGHVSYEPIESLKTGVSYLAFKRKSNEHLSTNHLLGIDLFWKKHGYEIQMEFAYRTAADKQGSERSGYLQGVAALTHNLFAIGRYEFVDGRHQLKLDSTTIDGTTHIGVAALAWKPFIPLVIKAEYRFGENNDLIAPSGFFTSVSMLF
jgi:hypothetical protein